MVKAIVCMKCGAPLSLTSPDARTIRCEFCDTLNQLDSEQNPVRLGKFVPKKGSGPLKVGARGNLRGQRPFTISGLLEYTMGGDSWVEYLCEFDDGENGWLQFDDGDWTLFFRQRLKGPVPEGLRPNMSVAVNGMQTTISEVGSARITNVGGQIPFAVDADEVVRFADGWTQDDRAISLEMTEDETELFVGSEVNRRIMGV